MIPKFKAVSGMGKHTYHMSLTLMQMPKIAPLKVMPKVMPLKAVPLQGAPLQGAPLQGGFGGPFGGFGGAPMQFLEEEVQAEQFGEVRVCVNERSNTAI